MKLFKLFKKGNGTKSGTFEMPPTQSHLDKNSRLIYRTSIRLIETSQFICRANQLTSFYMMKLTLLLT